MANCCVVFQIVCSWSKASGDALTKQQETIKDLLSGKKQTGLYSFVLKDAGHYW